MQLILAILFALALMGAHMRDHHGIPFFRAESPAVASVAYCPDPETGIYDQCSNTPWRGRA